MTYTLIGRKTMTFYIRSVAELYQRLYGGVIVSNCLECEVTELV